MNSNNDDQKNIYDLSEINIMINTKNSFKYKNINFYCNLKDNSTNLIIFFHGFVQGTGIDRIIYRGYNYCIDYTDIISISDGLLNVYDEFNIGWFLSTKKYKFDIIYKEIFKYFIYSKKYSKIIFTGSSGGGYPSIYWASYFNKIALISNSQLYIENYTYHHKLLNNMINQKNDKLQYINKNIEKHILTYKPQKIILYNNIKDYTYNLHTIPFIKFFKNNNLENLLELHLFSGVKTNSDQTEHTIFFPDNLKFNDILIKHLTEDNNSQDWNI